MTELSTSVYVIGVCVCVGGGGGGNDIHGTCCGSRKVDKMYVLYSLLGCR